MIEGVKNHGFDLLIGEAVGWLDFNLRLLTRALLARGNAENAVGVDKEFDLDARQTGGHGRNTFEVKARQ